MSPGLDLQPTSDAPSLDGLSRAERVQVMVDWFHENFEDPAMETPFESAEGGYQYIWGGPYDAMDELYTEFPDAAEDEIAEAADEVQSEGLFDWAPHRGRIRPDEFEYDSVGNAYVQQDYADPGYFAEDAPRATIEDRLAALGGQLDRIEQHVEYWRSRPAGMGHNGAPDEFRIAPDDQDLVEAEHSIAEIRGELAKTAPAETADAEVIARAESRFQKLAAKIRHLAVKAGINVASALAKGALTAVGGMVAAHYSPEISEFLKHLEEAAGHLNAWVQHLQML
ncbi:hypothetical protein MRBLMC3_001295 [Sphingobium sp. LMC3-1-1.1]|uniref:hypothetical protein n=1 Tax=Sphingobium sp. LMC3-1-1.1 TaxID=3135241 RepID=UPI003414A157